MCDCEKAKIDLLENLLREGKIHIVEVDSEGEETTITDLDSSYVPINAILNRIYKIKDLKDGKNNS